MVYWLVTVLKDYFSNATVHGLRFIAEDGRHWSERIFWSILCLLSWYGSALLIKSSWDAFQNNAISFVVETTYLHTNTSFPSISVCEEDNLARIYKVSQNLFGEDHDCNLDEVVKEITYFKGTGYYIKEFCFSGDIDCPKTNHSEIAKMVRSPCQDIFGQCFWRDQPFDCCSLFKQTDTELGMCFTLGNKHQKERQKQGLSYLSMESNRRVGLATLRIELNISSKVYLHSEVDVPFYNTMTTDIVSAGANLHKRYGIATKDIENEPEVKELSIHQRKCRFPEENYLESADYYSYSACVVDCRKKAQLEVCNCTSHLMPKSAPSERCNLDGLLCLNNHYTNLSVQKTMWGQKDGLICDCLPGCNDPEYNIVTVSSSIIPENISIIEIFLDRLPSERFKRNVVRGRLDLVVSMGGSAGLLVGASLLSFVEMIYFFTLRLRRSPGEKEATNTPPKQSESPFRRRPFTMLSSVQEANYNSRPLPNNKIHVIKYPPKGAFLD